VATILEAPVRQARTVETTAHRPWPLPDGPWAQAQTWEDLAFLHWPVDPELLRRLLPPEAPLDTFDGDAWLGVVPFQITNMRVRGLPPLPGLSTSPELNARTYVTVDGKPGVWFFTLDAASRWLVEAAKRLYRLPYERAQMTCARRGEYVYYESERAGGEFAARYRGHGPLFHAEPGSLEYFLVERYCLYTADGGRLYRAEIHHPPWDLQRGDAEIFRNTLSPVPLPDEDPHVLFSPRQDMVVWTLNEA
jgi:uncharacterized protein YqjF (DUF2071 family)